MKESIIIIDRGHLCPTTALDINLPRMPSPLFSAICAFAANMISPTLTPLGQLTSQVRQPMHDVMVLSSTSDVSSRPAILAPIRLSLPRATIVSSLVTPYVGQPAM